MVKIKSMSYEELEKFITDLGEPRFRARQVFEWMHKGVRSFDEMRNLPAKLRAVLKEKADLETLSLETRQISKKDGTRKYLFRLGDGEFVESVLMEYEHGSTVCVSTQVGCRMGCAFCASCASGLIRNLTAGEILDQVLAVSNDIGHKADNVVVMGIGEPFDNYDALIRFIDNINRKNGFNMGMRSITVSTCGLVPKIAEFGRAYPQVGFAVSLHAPEDGLRDKLMPVNKKYDLEELLKACGEYVKITNKRMTFEYILIDGVNDSEEYAEKLAARLKGILCHVNLIPFNGVEGKSLAPADRKKAEGFRDILKEKGFEATIRRELGSDIDGACGQLRSRRSSASEKSR